METKMTKLAEFASKQQEDYKLREQELDHANAQLSHVQGQLVKAEDQLEQWVAREAAWVIERGQLLAVQQDSDARIQLQAGGQEKVLEVLLLAVEFGWL